MAKNNKKYAEVIAQVKETKVSPIIRRTFGKSPSGHDGIELVFPQGLKLSKQDKLDLKAKGLTWSSNQGLYWGWAEKVDFDDVKDFVLAEVGEDVIGEFAKGNAKGKTTTAKAKTTKGKAKTTKGKAEAPAQAAPDLASTLTALCTELAASSKRQEERMNTLIELLGAKA